MHTQQEKEKLIARVRRIAGQIKAVEGALDPDQRPGTPKAEAAQERSVPSEPT